MNPEDGGMFLQNDGKQLPGYSAW